jgi:3-deoxy-manno-octulosonate cytidylyltransferase (CMP-KDO synthetase)
VRAGVDPASRIVVACDDPSILAACQTHGVEAVLTRQDHPSGTDRLAEASTLLNLADGEIVVNVQGDEPLIDTQLVQAVADLLTQHEDASMGTAAHAIAHIEDFINPNVVKVVLNAANKALYFSRAPIAWWRDGFSDGICTLPDPAPLRHIGIYAYRVGFLRRFPQLTQAPIETTEALEQLRAMWHGYRIAVHVSAHAPGPGVDTPEDLERARVLFALEANRADD